MFTTVLLLASLLSATDTPASEREREVLVDFGGGASFVFVLPASEDRGFRVAIGPGLRVVVPLLGKRPVPVAADQQQIFEFYMGFFC
jgi:hypothetical protein